MDPELAGQIEEFGQRFDLKEVRQLRALRAYIRAGKVKTAIEAAGVTYGTWYRWVNEEPEFKRALEFAKTIAADELEEIAFEKAKDSDTILLALLKAHRPEKYRDRQTITVVSPDVQGRLQRQADAIMEVCRMEISDTALRARVASGLATRLREIWT
jgi:hypothetical protein